jgi:mitogen-activated protein kinase kinase kinase 1
VDEDEEEAAVSEDIRLGQSSDDYTDTASTTTEFMFYISPNGTSSRKKIRSWSRGMLLGSGSFGTVYEAISE